MDRYDPYKNFTFRIKCDDTYVAGVNKVSFLTHASEVADHRKGRNPSGSRRPPGQTDNSPVTLERGLTYDLEFAEWANQAWTHGNTAGQEVSLRDFRKDIIIELHNEAGQSVIMFKILRCWVSEFTAVPELGGSENAVAIESMTLQHEGWERYTSLSEPAERSLG